MGHNTMELVMITEVVPGLSYNSVTFDFIIHLDRNELRTIEFIGGRYNWSDALACYCDVGENTFTWEEAQSLAECFSKDTDGGHSMFPMLDVNSALHDKLSTLFIEVYI
tara:strand:+ start:1224 stop:1550 length:327 start_codon:yes stop_codon:yes gene_type:complete